MIHALKEAGLFFEELPGVVPNPRVSLVRKGIEICREKDIDFLLAVGGGSVIDTCKAMSFGVYYEGDVWDLISGKTRPGEKRIPVADILTLPAAGSEESDSCVISDETIPMKTGFGSPLMRPVFSIMNPELTFTLPPYQPHAAAWISWPTPWKDISPGPKCGNDRSRNGRNPGHRNPQPAQSTGKPPGIMTQEPKSCYAEPGPRTT